MRRVISVLVAVVLLCGVGYAVYLNGDRPGDLDQVRVLIGSEKAEFFNDPEVAAEFKANGLDLRQQTIGSWSMATADLKDVDLAFPSSRGRPRRSRRTRASPPSRCGRSTRRWW
ncbi:hypothetical protein ACFQ0T_32500 [Kitasatospora gansuensis]